MLVIANGLEKFKLVFNQQLRKKKRRKTNTNYVFSLTLLLPVQCVCTGIGESK